MSERLRIELKFKNATLFNALREKFPPTNHLQKCADIHKAARQAGIGYSQIIGFLNLKYSPWGEDGNPRGIAEKLSLLLGVDCEQLFPRRLYSGVIPKTLVREIDGSHFISLQEARKQKLLPRSTEEIEDAIPAEVASDLREIIARVVDSLPVRKRNVIKMRFGLDSNSPMARKEIAEGYGVCTERIRQIEESAIRLLRKPCRSKGLYESVYGARQ
jgi:RNA polymerase primary sigma factor